MSTLDKLRSGVYCRILEDFIYDNENRCPSNCPDKGNKKRCPRIKSKIEARI